ncbi:MAG: iron chelate uptake ABC transporter family permease subunit, partial [Polyangiaceae bacterium]
MTPLLPSRLWSSLTMGAVVLVVSVVLATMYGTESVSMARVFSDPDSLDRMIVMEARLPRVLLGAVAGGGLAAVGVAFQAILRNPLAEPYVLGVS